MQTAGCSVTSRVGSAWTEGPAQPAGAVPASSPVLLSEQMQLQPHTLQAGCAWQQAPLLSSGGGICPPWAPAERCCRGPCAAGPTHSMAAVLLPRALQTAVHGSVRESSWTLPAPHRQPLPRGDSPAGAVGLCRAACCGPSPRGLPRGAGLVTGCA